MKRRLVAMIVVLMLSAVMAGCSGTGADSESAKTETEAGVSNSEKNDLDESQLSINDYVWSTDQVMFEGERVYATSLTNNSEYDLLGVEIRYKLKDDATEDDKALFSEFKESHADYIEEDDEFMLRGTKEIYVPSGEKVDMIGLALGAGTYTWYDVPNDNQFATMEPDYISLGIIKDNKVYVTYYDFINEKWTVNDSVEINKWEENELSDLLVEPDAPVYIATYNDFIQSFSIDAYGVDETDYQSYVEHMKENGFTEDVSEYGSFFDAEDANGNKIHVSYDEYTSSISVTLYYHEE